MKNTNNWRSRWKDTTSGGKRIVDIYTEDSGDVLQTINGALELGEGVVIVVSWCSNGKRTGVGKDIFDLVPINKVVVSDKVADAWINSKSGLYRVGLGEVITAYLKENNIPIPSPITRPSDGASY